jgi:hypothetical protein
LRSVFQLYFDESNKKMCTLDIGTEIFAEKANLFESIEDLKLISSLIASGNKKLGSAMAFDDGRIGLVAAI